VSVVGLFGVAVFWSFMADLFTSDQGKRLFGFIGAGGTAGSLLGPIITIGLSNPLGPVNLLWASAVLLELAVVCTWRLENTAAKSPTVAHATAAGGPAADRGVPAPGDSGPVGGSALAGLMEIARSPYLAGIGLWVSLLSLAATFLYLQQANIVAATIEDRAAQTRLFASIDLAVNLITLATQAFATGWLIKRFGVAMAAAALPAVYIVGLPALALAPGLAVVVGLQIAQRSTNFAMSNPARHILFTVVAREEKYKAKNIIDVVVYRGSDALWGAVFGMIQGMGISAIAAATLPVVVAWFGLSLALGRTHSRRAVPSVVAQPGVPS
jgi:AAA family ATP:ADP antiporter